MSPWQGFLISKKSKFALMHTTNLYPTPNELVRLKSITELNENFINLSIKERININLFKYSNGIKRVLKRNFFN